MNWEQAFTLIMLLRKRCEMKVTELNRVKKYIGKERLWGKFRKYEDNLRNNRQTKRCKIRKRRKKERKRESKKKRGESNLLILFPKQMLLFSFTFSSLLVQKKKKKNFQKRT